MLRIKECREATLHSTHSSPCAARDLTSSLAHTLMVTMAEPSQIWRSGFAGMLLPSKSHTLEPVTGLWSGALHRRPGNFAKTASYLRLVEK